MVLSTPTVPEFLTGREFLKFFLEINAGTLPDVRPLDEYFDWMRIGPEDRDKLLKDYSHGMKNKMQMLINILAQPKILLLDEPLTSLDVVVAEEMKQLLRSLKGGRIILFSTHILDLALDLCDENRAAQPRGAGSRGEVRPGQPGIQGKNHCGAERGDVCLTHCDCPFP